MKELIQKMKMFLKTKTFRIIKISLISLLALLLALFIGLRIYFEQNKESIMTDINQKINDNIAGHVSIGDVGYKFLIGFPNFTLVLNRVEVRDSLYAIHKRSALKA